MAAPPPESTPSSSSRRVRYAEKDTVWSPPPSPPPPPVMPDDFSDAVTPDSISVSTRSSTSSQPSTVSTSRSDIGSSPHIPKLSKQTSLSTRVKLPAGVERTDFHTFVFTSKPSVPIVVCCRVMVFVWLLIAIIIGFSSGAHKAGLIIPIVGFLISVAAGVLMAQKTIVEARTDQKTITVFTVVHAFAPCFPVKRRSFSFSPIEKIKIVRRNATHFGIKQKTKRTGPDSCLLRESAGERLFACFKGSSPQADIIIHDVPEGEPYATMWAEIIGLANGVPVLLTRGEEETTCVIV